jgi:uncharacterized protein (TIGR00251 family)
MIWKTLEMNPAFLKVRPEGVCLSVKVQPRAPRDEIGEVSGDELKIKVTAPPVDSAANEALVRLLAHVLQCPRSAVHVVQGDRSRHKRVLVEGMSPAVVEARLLRGPG